MKLTTTFCVHNCLLLLVFAALPVSRAMAVQTTVSREMKIAVDLDLKAPQSYYEFDGKTLSWREPASNDSHYLMATVRDVVSSHPMTASSVKAVITSLNGKMIGTTTTLHETWDKDQIHYGANIRLTDAQTSGDVSIVIEPAKGRRLGRNIGDFFTKPVTAEFEKVDFTRKSDVEDAKPDTKPVKVDWPNGRRPYIKPTPYPGSK